MSLSRFITEKLLKNSINFKIYYSLSSKIDIKQDLRHI